MKKILVKALAVCLLICLCVPSFSSCSALFGRKLGDILDLKKNEEKEKEPAKPQEDDKNANIQCAAGHSYNVYNKCEICGTMYADEDADLVIAEYREHCCVTDYTGSKTEINIPYKYKGKPVLSIDDYVFADYRKLEKIVFPSNLEAIGSHAFDNCQNLKEVLFVGNDALILIANNAFSGCISLESIDLPDSLNYLGEFAFSWCTALRSIDIPDSIETIHYSTFSNCSALENVSLPEGLLSIEHDGFINCSNLNAINIPSTVECIRPGSFKGCTNLAEISIPSSLNTLEPGVFADCVNLETVYFDGTVAQWHEVSRADNWDDGLSIDKIFCNDGIVQSK